MTDRRVVKSTIWYTISSLIVKASSLLSTPFFARQLTLEEYGYSLNYFAWYSVFSIIGTFSLSSTLVKARQDFKDDINSYIYTNLLFGSFATFVFMLTLMMNNTMSVNLLGLDERYIFIMCLSLIFSPAYDMYITMGKFSYHYEKVALITVCFSMSSILLSVLCVCVFKDKLLGRIVGCQIPICFFGVFFYLVYFVRKKHVAAKYLKFSLPLAVPYIIHLLSGTILNDSDRIMITKFCGADKSALYGMGYNVGFLVGTLALSMNSGFYPWFTERMDVEDFEGVKKSGNILVSVFSYIALGLMIFAPEIVFILGGNKYRGAEKIVPLVISGYVFLLCYYLFVNIEQNLKKVKAIASATCISAIINILLNYFLLPIFGYAVAALTTAVSYLFMMLFHYVNIKKIRQEKYFDFWFMLFVSCAMLGVSVIMCKLIYQILIIRMIFIVLYVIISSILLWHYRKKIFNYLS